jgi:hypothetical protein
VQNDKPTIEKRLADYVRSRDAVAVPVRSMRREELSALVRKAKMGVVLEPPSTIEQRLENYCLARNEVAKEVSDLHQADLNLLLAEVGKTRDGRRGRERTSILALLKQWRAIAAVVGAACVILMLSRPGPAGRNASVVSSSSGDAAQIHSEVVATRASLVGGSGEGISGTALAPTITSSGSKSVTADSTSNLASLQESHSVSGSMPPDSLAAVAPSSPKTPVSEPPTAPSITPQASPAEASFPNNVAVAETNAARIFTPAVTEATAQTTVATTSAKTPLDDSPAQAVSRETSIAHEGFPSAIAHSNREPLLTRSPVFRSSVSEDGTTQFSLLDPFGALLPKSKIINSTLTPLLAVWNVKKTPSGPTVKAFLWQVYRHSDSSNQRTDSVLFGLFQHKVLPDGSKKVRVLGIPF